MSWNWKGLCLLNFDFMLYRRKVLLAMLQAFDGHLEKIAFQKLLFLFTSRQTKPEYDFIPYHYGCYSITANVDLTAMAQSGLVSENESAFKKTDKANYVSKLTDADKKILTDIKTTYGKYNSRTLMKLVYLNYQYYAINSKSAQELLNEEQYAKVLAAKPKSNKTILFTIGYEGISLEEYLNRLVKNDVKVLVDVRNNPFSMKFGFSKNELKKYCENVGIEYAHVPEVGIRSDMRQELNSQEDYDTLFKTYQKSNLTETVKQQKEILELLQTKKRIALTCFEANICQCHRKPLAEAIAQLPGWDYELKHI